MTQKLPKVSIIIPIYNGRDYFEYALDSAINQTYKNIEVVVVNDGCKYDKTYRKIIKKKKNKKIRYFYIKQNKGVSAGLNLGIDKTTGDYVNWLSHDDVFHLNKIEDQIKSLNNNPNVISATNHYVFYNKTKLKLKYDNTSLNNYHSQILWLLQNDCLHGCSLLIPKKLLLENEGFASELKYTQDYDMWFKLIGKYRFLVLDKYYLFSRRHIQQGTFSRKDQSIVEKIFFYKKIILKISNLNLIEKNIKNTKEVFCSFISRGYINLGFFFLKILSKKAENNFRHRIYLSFILNIPFFLYLYFFFLLKNISNKVLNRIVFKI